MKKQKGYPYKIPTIYGSILLVNNEPKDLYTGCKAPAILTTSTRQSNNNDTPHNDSKHIAHST